MSSASDQIVFQESVEQQDNTMLFQEKKWTYITDSNSSNGAFNGQIQFDLSNLNNQWSDLKEAYIQFPVKMSIKTDTLLTVASTIDEFSATIKNNFANFCDSVQITLGGSTVQNSQIYTNIDTQYKILTEWSKDEFEKFGPSLGLSMDDYQFASDSASTTYNGLDNLAVTSLAPIYKGVVLNSTDTNPGFKERCNFLNNNVNDATKSSYAILGNNLASLGKGQAIFKKTAAANTECFCLHAIGTIRLKDISDFCNKAPLIKGMKGFIYLNYNSASSIFNVTSGTQTLRSAPTNSSIYGRCQPGAINANFTVTGDAAANPTLTFTTEISGSLTGDITSNVAQNLTNARLYCPYYICLPEIERVLSTNKTMRYHERFVTTFNIGANSNYSGTLSPGITNPKRVILYPYNYASAGAAGITAFATNPLLSPWDSAPSTTSPFAALKNLQITVGGKQIFQSPIDMDYQMFLEEVGENGLDGSKNSETTNSSLLNQRNWNQLYRFYTANIGRRMGSSDGSSKSVLLSCTNATSSLMSCICIIHYEREITIDTAMGSITQNL